jgi:NAD dependent epimerase/dehydratase family enzyme
LIFSTTARIFFAIIGYNIIDGKWTEQHKQLVMAYRYASGRTCMMIEMEQEKSARKRYTEL